MSTRVCILANFFEVVPHTQCVWWASSNSTWVAPKYSALHTTSILILVHTVFVLPGLSLAQCTRSTLFISSHTCQRDVLLCLRVLCLIPRLHSVFLIVVTVSLALWRANLFLAQCRVPQSHCTVILHNASLQYIISYYSVYSVTPVTAQDYNPLYTRVCIHTVFLSGLL